MENTEEPTRHLAAVPELDAPPATRCPAHPAYEPDNCPLCGTAAVIR